MLFNDTCALALHDVGEPVLRLARDRCDKCCVVHDLPVVACVCLYYRRDVCVSSRSPVPLVRLSADLDEIVV